MLDRGDMATDVGVEGVGDRAHDPGLVATARRDDASFVAFYEQHFRAVSGYATSLVGDAGHASDVTQEAMTRLYLRWGRVQDPRTWVYFVATNLTRDQWRRAKRERQLITALDPRVEPHDAAHDPWLRDLVERLPGRLREPVLLHYYADLPVEEVARVMRRPVGTIKQRLHQARQQLAEAAEGSR